MLIRWLLLVSGCCLLLVGNVGCDKLPFGGAAKSNDDFADFDDFEEEDAPAFEGDAATAHTHGTADPHLAVPEEPQYTATPAELSVQLQVGSRFPLVKTIEQRLTQQLPSGPVVGHTRLELQMSLLVEEQREGSRRMSVRYHRVRYSQDLGGEQMHYDSDAPPPSIPAAALAYAGLRDNTFGFWLGPDNRVGELVGFQEFLRRCVAHVPADQRNTAWQQLSSLGSEDGIASFVDDSIGLLPNPSDPQLAGKSLQVGSTWEMRPSLSQAGRAGTRCMLKTLTPQMAEIALMGSIEPSNYVDEVRQLKLTIRGGQCSGTCTVDRQTGMPTRSRIDRFVDMVAQLADGTEIPQRKEVVTTVVAYLDQSATAAHQVTPAGFQVAPPR